MAKSIDINQEESVIIHNAVIFMANDLMEEIQELEEWVKDSPEKEHLDELAEKMRRWDLMVKLTERVK